MKIVRWKDSEFIAASHEAQSSPGALKKVLVSRPDISGDTVQMVNWARLPKGRGFNAHYHEDMQELFVIINGRVRLIVDGQEHTLEAGDAVLIEAGAVHRMENISRHDVDYLVLGVSSGKGGKTVVV